MEIKTDTRVYACILESMKILSFSNGDTYYYSGWREVLVKGIFMWINWRCFLECLDYLEENNDVVRLEKEYI